MGNNNIIMIKIIFLLLISATCYGQDAKTIVVHGDTLWLKNFTTGDSLQLNRIIPSMAGQAGKVISTTGTAYEWVSQSGGSTDTVSLSNRINLKANAPTRVWLSGDVFAFSNTCIL